MQRTLKISIDSQSWHSNRQKVPSEISKLNSKLWTVNILHALIFTALCTRPPVSTGFSLSDYWAWLRYGRAISTRPNLTLCPEWEIVDPHQKTILSDELGIGFTTLLLAQKLGCLGFADTLYVVEKLFPHKFTFLSKAKNGQKKTPDYLGFDQSGDFYVLECKGTQVSQKALQEAIERGKEQKRNLSATSGTKVKYQLVAGLFIPQWKSSSQSPCIVVADPSWEEIEAFFEQIPPDDIKFAIVQITLAKCFSLIGLGRTAQFFAETPVEQLVALSEEVDQEIRDWLNASEDGVRVLFDSENLSVRPMPELGRESFEVGVPEHLLIELLNRDRGIRDILQDLRGSLQNRQGEWSFSESETNSTNATINTPLGFRFTLEIT